MKTIQPNASLIVVNIPAGFVVVTDNKGVTYELPIDEAFMWDDWGDEEEQCEFATRNKYVGYRVGKNLKRSGYLHSVQMTVIQ